MYTYTCMWTDRTCGVFWACMRLEPGGPGIATIVPAKTPILIQAPILFRLVFVRFGDLLGWCKCFARGRVAMAHPGLHQNAPQKLKRHFCLGFVAWV